VKLIPDLLRPIALSALLAVAFQARALVVQVDPAVPLTNATSLAEWNTDGDLDGWSASGMTGTTVSNGVLSATDDGTFTVAPQLQKLNFAAGPDLDMGYNDFLDLRLKLPVGYAGDVLLYYGTTKTAGIAASRLVAISNAVLRADGAFHIYRVELGLEPLWRGVLRDLRLIPLIGDAASGSSFEIDHLRVGDLAGDVYLPRYTSNCPEPGATAPTAVGGGLVSSMESKHFRVIWNPAVTVKAGWTANMPAGTLRNLEEVWQVHIKKLGYREPSESWTPALRNGNKYKVNLTMWHDGYWAGGDAGDFGWMNMTPDGLRVDPPTWVLPHEFGHVCQMHARVGGQTVEGVWWESHANYVREAWINHYRGSIDLGGVSNLDSFFAASAHWYHSHARHYYLCWPLFMYLDENLDNLPGLGGDFTARIWRETLPNEFIYDTIQRLAPAADLKDLVGLMARRNVTWNYANQAGLKSAAASGDADLLARWVIADLIQRPDDPTWWQVPLDKAPMQGAYTIHQLTPAGGGAGRVVSVNFRGQPNAARGADWRASFVVVNIAGKERYSSLWNSGTNSVTLAADENAVYLVVAGTPDDFIPAGQNDSQYPYQAHPQRMRFPYEVQVTGATPVESPPASTSGLVQHANGGGYRSPSSTVASTAYIGPNARVLNSARVLGNARIEDFAVVKNSAVVQDNAVVSGHALVRNSAGVRDRAKVRDFAQVIDSAVVSGDARVLGRAWVRDRAVITDWATVKGNAEIWRFDDTVAGQTVGGRIAGDAVVDGDYGGGRTITNGFQFGFLPYNQGPLEWINARTAPRRLFARYEFDQAHDSQAIDNVGVTHGYLRGGPAWRANDAGRSGTLAFDGDDDNAVLDRSVSDLREMTLMIWVKWSGGVASQPVFHFGTADSRRMFLTPDDGSGHAKFVIQNGGPELSLTAPSALPIGTWTQVTLSLSNATTGRLYLDGALVAEGPINVTPDQLNADNSNTGAQHNYLARGIGSSLPFFHGSLDDLRIYTGALTAEEIAAVLPPTSIASAGTLQVDLRATNAPTGPSGNWVNLGALGDFSRVGIPTLVDDVAGTGVPGVLFNGSSTAFQGPNSVADIDGASDRSIEVWAYNPGFVDEETMVSWGHRGTTRRDMAFNFGQHATWGAVTHWGDDVGWGTVPTANAWHHLVYTYSGTEARIYVDGVLRNSKTLGGALNTFAGEPINLGCQRETANGTRSLWFSGYLNTVRIHGGVLKADQVAANHLYGPSRIVPVNTPPTIATVPPQSVIGGAWLNVTNSANDAESSEFTWTLLEAPTGATLDPASGLFQWRAFVAPADSTATVKLAVADTGSPSLSATQTFTVNIVAPAAPTLEQFTVVHGRWTLRLAGDSGPDYFLDASTNLLNWTPLLATNPPVIPFWWTNEAFGPVQFYRVRLGPVAP
jgi:carbonic anhydrase/acetyltransferase-like protein (isoleucine patch superfamily)